VAAISENSGRNRELDPKTKIQINYIPKTVYFTRHWFYIEGVHAWQFSQIFLQKLRIKQLRLLNRSN